MHSKAIPGVQCLALTALTAQRLHLRGDKAEREFNATPFCVSDCQVGAMGWNGQCNELAGAGCLAACLSVAHLVAMPFILLFILFTSGVSLRHWSSSRLSAFFFSWTFYSHCNRES